MSDLKNEKHELTLEQLEQIAGGNIEEDATVVTVTALKDINAADGPGEVGQALYYGPLKSVAFFPAGSQIKVYIDYQMNGYVYSNTDIQPLGCAGYQFFYVKLTDVSVNQ